MPQHAGQAHVRQTRALCCDSGLMSPWPAACAGCLRCDPGLLCGHLALQVVARVLAAAFLSGQREERVHAVARHIVRLALSSPLASPGAGTVTRRELQSERVAVKPYGSQNVCAVPVEWRGGSDFYYWIVIFTRLDWDPALRVLLRLPHRARRDIRPSFWWNT